MNWTHCICDSCWTKLNPGRKAVVMVVASEETCCFCGENTESGLYIRADPREEPIKSHCKCVEDEETTA